MGRVVDLAEWKRRRAGGRHGPLRRLEHAVARLEARLAHPSARGLRRSPELARELRLVNGAVRAGRLHEAAERLEALVARLERAPAVGADP